MLIFSFVCFPQIQYGEGTECGSEGDIKVKFNHETTVQGRSDLKEKWYYKQCMTQKQSPEWRARGGNNLPTTEPCWLTLWDFSSARHYHWDFEFVKLTDRLKKIISTSRFVCYRYNFDIKIFNYREFLSCLLKKFNQERKVIMGIFLISLSYIQSNFLSIFEISNENWTLSNK